MVATTSASQVVSWGLSGGGGEFSENLVVSAEKVVPFPGGVPAESAALVEPFTVSVHAVERSGLRSGDSVVVFGSGPIGLTVLQAALAAGAEPVYVSEPRITRRELAAEYGPARPSTRAKRILSRTFATRSVVFEGGPLSDREFGTTV